jgi:uridine phosphorylase
MIQRPIDESGLNITPQGCMEHLGLSPGELAETIILVSDPGLAELISSYFDSIEHKKSHREFDTYTGYISSKRISVIATGTGAANIDIALNELDALLNIDFDTRIPYETHRHLNIIKLGTCRGLRPDIPADSLVVATFGIGLDNLLHYYRYENNAEETFLLHAFQQYCALPGNSIQPYIAEGSVRLRNHFTEGFIHGIFVTSPGFYAPQGRRLRLSPAHTHLADNLLGFISGSHRIIGCDMETSAIYGLGKLLTHHCISISVVMNKTSNLPPAMDNMIQKTLDVIKQI